MEASAEIVGVILLSLIAISLATIVHGVVMSSIPHPESPEFTPPPEIVSAKMRFVSGEESYTELDLELSRCSGIKDTYVTLVGHTGTGEKGIVGSALLTGCSKEKVSVRLPLPQEAFDRYTVYLSKYGVKSKEVNVVLVEDSVGGE